MKRHIPNTLTCLNLFSGCLSVVMAFNHDYRAAFGFILLSALFDFFDGLAARALNALETANIEVLLITTSDLDISLLVRAENEDAAYEVLKKAYQL